MVWIQGKKLGFELIALEKGNFLPNNLITWDLVQVTDAADCTTGLGCPVDIDCNGGLVGSGHGVVDDDEIWYCWCVWLLGERLGV